MSPVTFGVKNVMIIPWNKKLYLTSTVLQHFYCKCLRTWHSKQFWIAINDNNLTKQNLYSEICYAEPVWQIYLPCAYQIFYIAHTAWLLCTIPTDLSLTNQDLLNPWKWSVKSFYWTAAAICPCYPRNKGRKVRSSLHSHITNQTHDIGKLLFWTWHHVHW